jgi:choline dehydrogenase-like flavoprotein
MERASHTSILPTPVQLAGVSAALLPPEDGGPDPTRIAYLTANYLRQAPPLVQASTKLGVSSLSLLARLAYRKPLEDLDATQRAKLMERLERHPTTAQAIQGIKALILLSYGAEKHRDELIAAAKASRLTKPDPPLSVERSQDVSSTIRADAVVIGSGAGGAVAALRLAEKGMSVVVLEEGRRFSVEEFRTQHPLKRFASLYRGAGTTVALGSPPIPIPLGWGVGGTTLVNSGTCYRTPKKVLRRWADEERLDAADEAELDEHFAFVEEMLDIGPVPYEVMGNNGKLVLEGAKALGLSAGPLDRNAPGCQGTCQCAIGCPTNAKAGVHLSVLPAACKLGATIVSEARVERILTDDGRARGVYARRPDGSPIFVEAPRVVVAAGSIETPLLLRRSGLGGHRRLGRNLTVHPAFAVIGIFEDEIVPWRGVLQSAGVDSYHEERGVLMEATSAPPGMTSAMLPGWGQELVRQVEMMKYTATLGAMIADRPSGVVYGKTNPVIVYRLHREDATRLMWAMIECAKVLDAAGAKGFIAPIAGLAPQQTIADFEEAVRGADPRRLHLAAFHPVGTAASGGIPERHPVDHRGALRGVEGVWVCDGSVLPGCPTVNPQVTIMALASAFASRIE